MCYNAIAELACYLCLGWGLPSRVVDLLVEFRLITNGSDWREGEDNKHKLIHAVGYFGMNVMDAVEKSTMQALGMRGQPFSSQERCDLMNYCERDVLVATELLRRMAPELNIQALQRGRFTRTAATMLHRGIPLDSEIYAQLQQRREPIVNALISEVNPRFGVFRGTEFQQDRMEAFIGRHNLRWPRLDSGCPSMDKRTWERMVEWYPFLDPLHQARGLLSLLRDTSLAIGRDGRNRYGFSPFAQATGRNTWKASEFIFAQQSYLRGLIQPRPGKGLAYLDYSSQEIAVAASLSGDKRMMEAYASSDPYLAFGRQAGLIPPGGTKETHGAMRGVLKRCVLGLQYLISESGLAEQLDIQRDYARDFMNAHRRVYSRFWEWVEAVIDRAIIDGYVETVLGWRFTIRDGEVLRNGKVARLFNHRAAVNFGVQGAAADITRLACNLASEKGIALLANVHDALLIEGDADVIDDLADDVSGMMVQAGRDLLNGLNLRVERQVVRYPQRLLTGKVDRERWAWLRGKLGMPADGVM